MMYFCGAGVLVYFLWLKWMFDHAPQDPNDIDRDYMP